MKAIFKLAVLLAALCFALGSAAHHAGSTVCKQNNPFIHAMAHIKNIYNEPKTALGAPNPCQGEWDVYGTCCDEWQFPFQTRFDAQEINDAKNKIITEYRLFKDSMRTFFKQLQRFAFMPNKPPGWDPYLDSCKLKARTILNSDYSLKIMRDIMVADPNDANRFEQVTNRCWDRVVRGRADVYCHICSGRSHTMFEAGGRPKISKRLCTELIENDCLESLDKLQKFASSLRQIRFNYQEVYNMGLRLNFDVKLNWNAKVDEVLGKFTAARIPEFVAAFKKGDNPSLRNVCEAILNINNPTWVQVIMDMFSVVGGQWTVNTDGYINGWMDTNQGVIDGELATWRQQTGINL